ncbi:hypothetical protein HX021_08360 [Sphingobacterium sp. N143]|uniref:hypothetical protein n=1 Tax=Sphingobacterium sp. N143 TaxID=2746727 RepID=UPI0025772F32|nr:hypothetical protein [Sphingobacterium sp. N143]MDM1294310.1 hypothetical protein [Sphingobacterium sp. N143]
MGFSAKLEADLTNWSGNIKKAGKEFDNFASKTQKDINAINNAFKKVNGNSIGGLQNRLTLLKQNLENATDIKSISKYNIRIKETQDEIERLKNLGLQAGNATKNIVPPSTVNGVNNLTRSFGAANGVAMEFNRIIQDAPFGMMGIGNNIQQLTSNFAVLKSQTGSTGAAIKATFASMLSSGNLLALGVAAITSAWTAYTMWSQRANKATKDNKSEFDKLVESLSDVSTVMYEAAKSSGQEASELRALYSISQDTTQSVDERKNAAQRLIKQYPELFGKFNSEQIMLGKAKGAYDELSKSILATARAQAAYGKIGEKFSQQIALDETNKALQKEIDLNKTAIAQNKIKAESLRNSVTLGSGKDQAEVAIRTADALDRSMMLNDRIAKLEKQKADNLLKRAVLQEGINDLENIAITNQIAVNNQYGLGVDKVEDLTDKIAGLNTELNQFIQQGRDQRLLITQLENIDIKYNEIYEVIKEIGNVDPFKIALIGGMKLEEQLDAVISKMKPATADPSLDFTLPDIQPGDLNINPLAKGLDDIKSRFETTRDAIGEIMGDGLVSVISNSMSALGEALATGGNILGAIGDSLISTLGGLAKQIGEQMIAFGTAGIALKFMVSNPFLAIAAGAALVALGSFASSSVSRSVESGTNGGYFGYQSQDYSSYRGALYNNERQQTVDLRIKGDDLVGSFDINNTRNNRLS